MPNVYYSLDDLPKGKNTIITIGTFDGVHKGHQKILQQVNKLKDHSKLESLVFTFDPHPRKVLFPNSDLKLITSTPEKVDLLFKLGIDNILVYPFSKSFAELSSEEYIRGILVGKLGAKKIIIGYDHRFGKDRSGNIDTLRQFGEELDFEVIEIPAQDIDHINISSTRIRKAIENGEMEEAFNFLGHHFFINGTVVEGKKLGRTIGYPTANINVPDPEKIIPPIGVYAVTVEHKDTQFNGMLSIGTNPTTDNDNKIKIEVNIFDFNETIYGEHIKVNFVKRLRDEVKFANLDELKQQLLQDKLNSLKVLA